MASEISVTTRESNYKVISFVRDSSGASCAGAVRASTSGCFKIQLVFRGQCSCMQIDPLLLKSPLFCFFSRGHRRERDGGKHQWLSGKLSSNKVLIRTVCEWRRRRQQHLIRMKTPHCARGSRHRQHDHWKLDLEKMPCDRCQYFMKRCPHSQTAYQPLLF